MKHSYPFYALALLTLAGLQAEESASTKSKRLTKSSQTKGTQIVKKTTASGLAYEVLKEGSGAMPTTGKSVTVHYTGWLDKDGMPSGNPFDSSVTRGKPFMFILGVGQVIKGWDEGVKDMKVGEVRRLYIPASLGYGARGASGVIPPNAALIFDVELLAV